MSCWNFPFLRWPWKSLSCRNRLIKPKTKLSDADCFLIRKHERRDVDVYLA
jgi:hypothetical protein